jgi:hypothetical protein
MTQLPSQRLVGALADLEELKAELAHERTLSERQIMRFESIRDTINHMLQCLCGHAHEEDQRGYN